MIAALLLLALLAEPPPASSNPTPAVAHASMEPTAAPPPASAGPTGPVFLQPAPPPAARSDFVWSWWIGPVVGISPIPSIAPATFFLGARTRSAWAVGYQFALSLGGAERYWGTLFLPLAHRHHVHAMRSFGRNRRGLVGTGGGVAFIAPLSPVVEVEGRVGVRFGSGKWHFGGLVRLGWDVGHREYAPMPQFGLFIGVTNL